MDPERAEPSPQVDIRDLSRSMYERMRAIGGRMMRDERQGHTLSPTALVGAAVERLLEHDQSRFNDRHHLLAAAAMAMRRVLVEHARARGRHKRGGGLGRVSWDQVVGAVSSEEAPELLLSIDEAIDAIGREDGRYARIIELRLFGALSNAEIARVLAVSVSTVEKDWKYLKPRLLSMLGEEVR